MYVIVTFTRDGKKVSFYPDNKSPQFFDTFGKAFDLRKDHIDNPLLARIVNLTYYEGNDDDW